MEEREGNIILIVGNYMVYLEYYVIMIKRDIYYFKIGVNLRFCVLSLWCTGCVKRRKEKREREN